MAKDTKVAEIQAEDINWDDIELEELAELEEEAKVKAPKKAKAAKKTKAEPELDEEGNPVKQSRKRRYTDEQAGNMYRLYLLGHSKKAIAEEFGCSPVFVYNMVNRRVYQDLDFSHIDAEVQAELAERAAIEAAEAEAAAKAAQEAEAAASE